MKSKKQLWKTWKHKGLSFIAFQLPNFEWTVCDENGDFYGYFMDIPKPEDMKTRWDARGEVYYIHPILTNPQKTS